MINQGKLYIVGSLFCIDAIIFSKFSTLEIGDEVDPLGLISQDIPTKIFHNTIFNDNFGITFNDSRRKTTNSVNPIHILDCLFYIGNYNNRFTFFHIIQ